MGPYNGQYAIPNTGITLVFSAEDAAFASGDRFIFSSTAPQATIGEAPAAIDQILDAKLPVEWIAVAGISSAPLWAALAVKAEGAEAVIGTFSLLPRRGISPGETLDRWVNALAGTERGTTVSPRLRICAGWIEEADPNGQVDVRGIIAACTAGNLPPWMSTKGLAR
jgi:hypothetical protein